MGRASRRKRERRAAAQRAAFVWLAPLPLELAEPETQWEQDKKRVLWQMEQYDKALRGEPNEWASQTCELCELHEH
jgi:hypothetical protein